MDTLRGNLSGFVSPEDDGTNYDRGEDELSRELPPAAIGQDERRMQVRAYNFWASLLTDRNLPSIEDLDPDNLPDFGPNSVLLDFSCGIEDPAIVFLGDKLAAECGSTGPIKKLSDVPTRSLLSRITDHHLQIIANQAPIGFEAEFVNQSGAAVMYRGILLPFSSDDDTIDFIFGVINWKEIADQQTTDALLHEIDQALAAAPEVPRNDDLLTDWADGPLDHAGAESDAPSGAGFSDDWDEVIAPEPLDLDAWQVADENTNTPEITAAEAGAGQDDAPPSIFGRRRRGLVADQAWAPEPEPEAEVADLPTSLEITGPVPVEYDPEPEPELEELDLAAFAEFAEPQTESDSHFNSDNGLADLLAAAREVADAAHASEDRSRQSLYAAIGRAYDFSLAAAADPDGFAELVADAGLTVQERAPLTPLVKLVFGANYDKTRLTEYATALGHATRLGLGAGSLENFLLMAPGGLKGVVQAERELRRAESGADAAPKLAPGERLARKLRKLDTLPLSEVPAEGSEFTLLVARRLPTGEVVLLGEVGDDLPLLERAARRLIS